MKSTRQWIGLSAGAALMALGLLAACDVSPSSTATRNVPIVVEGFYSRASGEPMVSRTSGADVLSLNVRQNGDQLEAIDNNGMVFRGTIGQVIETTRATFTMEGSSTAGNRATLSGNFNVNGNVSAMTGSWIEDTLVGQIFATALVPTNAVPEEPDDVAIAPSTANLQVGQSATFTASGGSGPFNWSLSNTSLATITPSGERSATLALVARVAGSLVLTVRDSSTPTGSATANITITAIDDGGGGGEEEAALAAGGPGTGSSTQPSDSGTPTTLPPTPGQ